jgi:hypothetical protein
LAVIAGKLAMAGAMQNPGNSKVLFTFSVFQDEAQKKTLEANLLAGEELQALSKEVVIQPPEIIAQIRKLMGE